MAKDYLHFKMEADMTANLDMGKSMSMVSTHGPMALLTMANGAKIRSTVKEFIPTKKEKKLNKYGKMVIL